MTPKRAQNTDYERLVAQETLILDATETIIELLEQTGVSRQELAARLGKSKGFISQLLSGERNMTLRTLADLAYMLEHRVALTTKDLAETGRVGEAPSGELSAETPGDQEIRAETPVDAVAEWSDAPVSADAHEYALAA
jgi:transcriptional regulator with XRE-family HTH domain